MNALVELPAGYCWHGIPERWCDRCVCPLCTCEVCGGEGCLRCAGVCLCSGEAVGS